MKKINFFVLLIALLVSCSRFTQKIDNLADSNKTFDKVNLVKEVETCQLSEDQFLIENKNSEEMYKSISKLSFYKKANFIDKALSLVLLELLRRPDKISLNGKIQFFIRKNGINEYIEFSPSLNNNHNQSFMSAVEYLASRDARLNLNEFIQVLDRELPKTLNVDNQLEIFLMKNSKELLKNKHWSSNFFKADEPITRFESFFRANLKSLFAQDKKTNSLNISSLKKDFPFQKAYLDTKAFCNFDSSNDVEDIVANELSEKELIHYVGLKSKSDFFLAFFSSTSENNFKNVGENYFSLAPPPKNSIPACLFLKHNSTIFLASIEGRSKIQNLKHLIEYEFYNSNSYSSLEETLNFPRHLFLTNPDRILYESKRGRKDQLNIFLNMNFPIYHAEKIGLVVGMSEYLNKDKETNGRLIFDSRSNGETWCVK